MYTKHPWWVCVILTIEWYHLFWTTIQLSLVPKAEQTSQVELFDPRQSSQVFCTSKDGEFTVTSLLQYSTIACFNFYTVSIWKLYHQNYASVLFPAVVLQYRYLRTCFKWAGFGVRAAGHSNVELRRACKNHLRTMEWARKQRTE